MRVSVSSFGRFWAFNLAHQLERRDLLRQLIASYPYAEVQKYGISKDRVDTILWPEIARRLYFRLPPIVRGSDVALHWLAERFDSAAARKLAPDVDLVAGLSSFSERTLLAARSRGARTVVERGSSHIEYQRDILAEEYARFQAVPHLPHPEVVAKELREYEIADAINVPSSFARRTFLEKGIPPERVITVPYGVDLTQFPLRGTPPAKFRALYVGGMSLRKGVHYLLQAWQELALHGAELWLVGHMNPEIEPFFHRFQGSFKYFGHVPQAKLHEFYAQCSVFVICTVEDGMPLVVPQAMSCGLPVICTENCIGTDLVNDGFEGFVIPIRDVAAIKERLMYLYENQDLCAEMGLRARRRVESGSTWDDYGRRVASAYAGLVGAHCEAGPGSGKCHCSGRALRG